MNKTSFMGDKPVNRIGFGAMQLAGPGVFGPPRDPDAARAVLRRAIELGVDHIDTAQYYGPDVVNDLIRESLHPVSGEPEAGHQGRRPPRRPGRLAARAESRRAARRRRGQPPLPAGGADGSRQPPSDRHDDVRRSPGRAARHAGGSTRRGQARPDRHQRGRRRCRRPRARAGRHRRGAELLQRRQPLRRGRARAVHGATRSRSCPTSRSVRRSAAAPSSWRRIRSSPASRSGTGSRSRRSRSPGCCPATSGCS